MQVTQPKEIYRGIPKEDVFFVLDDMGTQIGEGYLIYQYQPAIFPQRPVNIYFSMNATPQGEYMLLGSLAARARLLRAQHPNAPARLYTNVQPQDTQKLTFLQHNGFDMNHTEDLLRLNQPAEVPQIFNTACVPVPVNTTAEQMNVVNCMRNAGFSYFDHGFLLQQLNRPNNIVLGLLYGSNLVGMCVAAGQYSSAEVMGLYIEPAFQHRSMGTQLLARTQQALSSMGVNELTMRIMNDSAPQAHLAQRFQCELIEHTTIFPSMQI